MYIKFLLLLGVEGMCVSFYSFTVESNGIAFFLMLANIALVAYWWDKLDKKNK